MLKKILALLVAVVMVCGFAAACGQAPTTEPSAPVTEPATPEAPVDPAAPADPAASAEPTGEANPLPDWTAYNDLIAQIKAEPDFMAREALMHQAEDLLMSTGAILPIYYYNDIFMQKPSVQGMYASVFGTKYFMYTTNGDNTTLRLQLSSEPAHLDPALNSSVDGACLAANAFGGLYTYGADGLLKPEFADGYTVSEDGLTYTFTLKEGLLWSDGTPLTAADFVYSWQRAVNPETAADYAYMFDCIKGYADGVLDVTAEGNVITVNLNAPCAYFLDLAAFPTYYPVQQTAIENAEGYKDENGTVINPGAWALEAGFASCGAYMLESWTHEESMVYVKNPNYWDAANVKLERLEFMLSADDTAVYAAYQAGDLDFIDTVPNDEIATLLADNNPEFNIVDNLGTYYVCFNVQSPLFAGKTAEQANAMRLAIARLVDRQYIAETVGQTGQVPATSFIPLKMADGHGGEFKVNDDAYSYADTASCGYYPVDVDVAAAIELLKQAGYEFDGEMLSANTPISFEYLTNESTGHIKIAECIQQDLAAVGIQMTIKSVDWNVFLDERKAGNYDVARNGWLADFNDPINMLEMWTTDSGNNDCQFGREMPEA